jgi:hypothetical protein
MTSTPIFDALAAELLDEDKDSGEPVDQSVDRSGLDAPLSGRLPAAADRG